MEQCGYGRNRILTLREHRKSDDEAVEAEQAAEEAGFF
jgi:hypothetical protein